MIDTAGWQEFINRGSGEVVHAAFVVALGFEPEVGADGRRLPPNPLTDKAENTLLISVSSEPNAEGKIVVTGLDVDADTRARAVIQSVMTVGTDGKAEFYDVETFQNRFRRETEA